MANLKTKYLGIEISNPIVVSSSGLSDTIGKIKDIEDAGAGAVVLKSLFEEQILNKADVLMGDQYYDAYPEAYDYINSYVKSNDIENYISLIKDAKAEVNIPIIASINCVSADGWTEFAQQIENAGADALEVNIFVMPTDKQRTSAEYEEIYLNVARSLNKQIKIPFSLKIGSSFTNLTEMSANLETLGAKGLVLFNRFFEPDIDIDNLSVVSAPRLSFPSEIRKSLRWIGMLSDSNRDLDLVASTGVHDSEALIKLLLVGAQAVQVCSVVYAEGLDVIKELKEGLSDWMDEKKFETIEDFRYKLNYENSNASEIYERSQFMKHFSSAKDVQY